MNFSDILDVRLNSNEFQWMRRREKRIWALAHLAYWPSFQLSDFFGQL